MTDRRFPAKLFVFLFTVVTIGLAFEFYYELSHAVMPSGFPNAGQPVHWGDLTLSPAMVRASASPFARAYNNIVALLLTFIAIAIPITANMYTPRLINLFLRDKLNLTVLCLGGAFAAHSVFAASMAFDVMVGHAAFWISCFGAMLGWVGLIPYYYYVLQFLDPETIIELVTKSIITELDEMARGRSSVAVEQRRLNRKIMHLGSVILQSIGRSDRDVSIEAVRAVARVLHAYETRKPALDRRFLAIDHEIFTGLSHGAIEIINRDGIWIEQKCLQQLALAYSAALAKMPDAVSTVSDVVKQLAHETAQGNRPEVMALYVRYFNGFIREAIMKKDVHAIYDVFYQYKSLARKLLDSHPEIAIEMAGHFKYYAEMARGANMPFIYDLASYELAELCRAERRSGPGRPDRAILMTLLAFEGAESSARIVKSRALLGGYFVGKGLREEAGLVAGSLGPAPKALLEQAHREIMNTRSAIFWEVTDRQTNFDYVDDDAKAKVSEFLSRIQKYRIQK